MRSVLVLALVLAYAFTPFLSFAFSHGCECGMDGHACGASGYICVCCSGEFGPEKELSLKKCGASSSVEMHAQPLADIVIAEGPAVPGLAKDTVLSSAEFASPGFTSPPLRPPQT